MEGQICVVCGAEHSERNPVTETPCPYDSIFGDRSEHFYCELCLEDAEMSRAEFMADFYGI